VIVEARDGWVDVDYYSLYLWCPDGDWLSDQISDLDAEAHLAAVGGFVYIGTCCQSGMVPVRLEVHDGMPARPEPDWQHVVEVSLTTSGAVEVRGLDDEPSVKMSVPPGPIRLRALWTGIDPEARDEDGGNLTERLTFQLWPAALAERVVLRWWTGWVLPELSPMSADGRRQVEGVTAVVRRLGELRRLPMLPRDLPFPGDTGVYTNPEAISLMHGVLGDISDGSWWADGYSARRTLREITDEELRGLITTCDPSAWPLYRLPGTHEDLCLETPTYAEPPVDYDDPRLVAADLHWLAMLKKVGYPTKIIELR
jgi:hypothetical protein